MRHEEAVMTDSNATHGETINRNRIFASNILYDFSFSSFGQEFEWSCWYACTQMMFQWAKEAPIDGYSPDKVDEQLIARAWGTQDALQASKQNGLDPKKGEFEKLRSAVGYHAIGSETASKWDQDALFDMLDQMGPLFWCRKVENPNPKPGDDNWTYHAMIIRGFETSGTGTLTVINPYDSPPNSRVAKDTTFLFFTFRSQLAPVGTAAAPTALMALGKPQKT
jgi:hypothetical protein